MCGCVCVLIGQELSELVEFHLFLSVLAFMALVARNRRICLYQKTLNFALIDLQITCFEKKTFLSSQALLRVGNLFPQKFYFILIDENFVTSLKGAHQPTTKTILLCPTIRRSQISLCYSKRNLTTSSCSAADKQGSSRIKGLVKIQKTLSTNICTENLATADGIFLSECINFYNKQRWFLDSKSALFFLRYN